MGMSLRMFSVAVLSSLVVAVVLGQDDGIRCGECIMEMHRFGGIIHSEAHVLADYLADNYCPTIEEEHQEGCPGHLAQHYPDMLGACSCSQIHLERRGSPAHVHNHGGLPSQAEGVSP